MTSIAMITGTLQAVPIVRPTRNGGKFAGFKLRVINGSMTEYWGCMAFGDTARREIAGLKEGDAACAVGAFRVESYMHAGEKRWSLKMTVSRVLTLKAENPKPERQEATRFPHMQHTAPPFFDIEYPIDQYQINDAILIDAPLVRKEEIDDDIPF
jgi:hypothetical protein